MRLFYEIARRSFQRHLTYRAATIAGLVTNFFFGLLRVAILLALYGEQEEVAGITVAGVITYTVLTQAILAYLSIFGWYDLMNSVHTGEVATDLLKPVNFFTFWLAQDVGRAVLNFWLRGVLLMIVYALVFDLIYPTTLLQWLALLVALIFSLLLSFAWRFLINLSAFWTPNARGIGRLGFVLTLFLSGFLMPLRFFPDWVTRLIYLTPFPHMLNTVIEIYLGIVQGPQLLQLLLVQAAWTLLLILACQLILQAGVKRLVILGG
jgi:ABC-2 type transport system permease protein